MVKPGNTNWGGKLSTVDLPIKIAWFVQKQVMFVLSKAADPNKLVKGGQMYWSFPFCKTSLVKPTAIHKLT
jgi:hypothetical protein